MVVTLSQAQVPLNPTLNPKNGGNTWYIGVTSGSSSEGESPTSLIRGSFKSFINGLLGPVLMPVLVVSRWGFPEIRGTLFGVAIIRIIIYWGLYWVPLILGNYTRSPKHTNCDLGPSTRAFAWYGSLVWLAKSRYCNGRS